MISGMFLLNGSEVKGLAWEKHPSYFTLGGFSSDNIYDAED